MKLPQEVISFIVNYTDDLETLKNWARVSWATRADAERLLWRDVVVHHDRCFLYEGWVQPVGTADQLRSLLSEVLNKDNSEQFEELEDSLPHICQRAPFVSHFSFRAKWLWEVDNIGGACLDVVGVFSKLSPVLLNLRSIRIDGQLGQGEWDILLLLPCLRELRLWRSQHRGPGVVTFEGLSKLEAFEFGSLTCVEAAALGTAVRKSSLKRLHISIKHDLDLSRTESLRTFFEALVKLDPNEEGISSSMIGNSGFPSSLVELAIEDEDSVQFIPDFVRKAFERCSRLNSLYLDLKRRDYIDRFIANVYLPMLTHLYLPLIKTPSGFHLRSSTNAVARFVQQHRETLKVFQVLNAAEDHEYVKTFCRKLEDSYSLQELRMDFQHTVGMPQHEEWERAADFLARTGKKDWGHNVHRIRLDRFDLEDIHVGFENADTWRDTKILVLNPRLEWHHGLFPDPNEARSMRAQYLDRKHALGLTNHHDASTEIAIVQDLLGKIGPKIRVISINGYRFWIEPTTQMIWHLRDALKDSAQSILIELSLDTADWEFLSERATTMSPRGANTARFLRIDRERRKEELYDTHV